LPFSREAILPQVVASQRLAAKNRLVASVEVVEIAEVKQRDDASLRLGHPD
jgi:hypothetical protein